MDRNEIFNELYRLKSEFKPYAAYCTTVKTLPLQDWNGKHPVEENVTYRDVSPGTVLRIVMVSRFNDFGVTDELDREHGYKLRLGLDTDAVTDFRWDVNDDSL